MPDTGTVLTLIPGSVMPNSREEYRCNDAYEGDGYRTLFKTTLSRHFSMPKTSTLLELLVLNGAKFVRRYKLR